MGNETSPSDQKTEDQQAPRLSVECCAHAYECQDPKCTRRFCSRIKRVLHHKMTCKRRTKGGCLICREISALCFDHVKQCKDDKCPAPVPFCLNLKKKMKRQQRHLRRLTAMNLRSSHSHTRCPGSVNPKHGQCSHKLRIKHTDECWTRISSGCQRGGSVLSFSPNVTTNQMSLVKQAFVPRVVAEVEVTLQETDVVSDQVWTHSGETRLPSLCRTNKEKTPFQQLMDALQAPDSADQQLRILCILNNNPMLIKEYLMHRLCEAHRRLTTLEAQKKYLESLNL